MGMLQGICPDFTVDLAAFADAELGFHNIMMSFAWCSIAGLTEGQLQALGMVLNQAVAEDDALENAVSTCFLEHLRQINGYQALEAYLDERAKAKTRP
jgi:hypothetical protein